ncbi:MAG: PAS domain S-box protein [Smithella sp.]
MCDSSKEHQDLINENALLKQRIQDLKKSETKLKMVEETLRDTEMRYRLLFEHSPDGILIIDSATAGLLEFNEAAHRQLGYSREEFANLSVSDLEVAETPRETRSHMAHVIQKGRAAFNTLQRNRQGQIRNVHVTAQYTEVLGKPVYHCVWRDITERKQVEDKLRAQEEKYRALFNNARVALFRTRIHDGKLIEVNKRYAEKAGYSTVEECVAKFNAASAWVDPNGRKAMLQVLQEKGSVSDYETEIIRRDGSHIWISFAATIFPEQGVIEGSIVDITDRKKAEDALRERIKELNCIYSIADLINKTDCMGEIFQGTVNLMVQGFQYPEIACARIKLGDREFKTDNFKETKWKMSADLIAQNKPVGLLEIYYIDERPIRYEGPFLKEERSLLNIIATRMGIVTERHQENDALLESEIKFKSFAEQAIVGTYILQDGIFKYVNPRFAQMFGYTVEECLTNMSFETLVYPDDLANVKEEIRRRISGETEFSHYTFKGLKKNGEIFHVEIYGSSSVHKGRPAAAGTLLDITESKKMEAALKKSDERFRALFDHSLDGVFIHDLEGNFLDFNQAVLKNIGYDREEIPFLNFASLMEQNEVGKAKQVVEEILRFGIQKKPSEFKLKRKNGSYLYVETLSSVIFHDDNPCAIVGIARDLTERKLAEQERLRLEKLQGVLEMAGTICHEMNQPMQIISGYSEMLLNISDNHPIYAKLNTINDQIQRMSDITKKLMNIKNFDTQDYAGFGRIININKFSSNNNEIDRTGDYHE